VNGTFYIGATGLDAQQRALDVVANNIANLATPGFKRSSARFSALMASTSKSTDQADPYSQAMLGVSVDTSPMDFTQGQLTQTGKSLDVAISGDGFIELMGPGGQSLLWRGGSMQVNSDGYLAASNGAPLKSMISVPSDGSTLSIQADGSVLAVAADNTSKVIGQIDLVQDKNMAGLTPVAGGFYQADNAHDLRSAAPGVDGAGTLVAGSVEASNVNLADEMVTLLLLQRSYSASAQVVQAGDQLMSIANSLRR
jgi:flagellar basal-body rod protein FlgG